VCDAGGEVFAPELVLFPRARHENLEALRLPPQVYLRNLPGRLWPRSLRLGLRATGGLRLGGEPTEHVLHPGDRRAPSVRPGLPGAQGAGGSAAQKQSVADPAAGG
jgi:hypothetical protein